MTEHFHGGLLKWIELHPGTASWVQAIGSVTAIAVAIWIPWRIHRREQTAAQSARLAYRRILKDALVDLEKPLVQLSAFLQQPFVPVLEERDGLPLRKWTEEHKNKATQMAADMREALSAMAGAAEVLDELKAIEGIDTFDVIRSLFYLRRELQERLPLMEREAHLLGEHPKPGVVEVAIEKLNLPTSDLLAKVQAAISALKTPPPKQR